MPRAATAIGVMPRKIAAKI
ncbi:hypothetical protein PG990_014918 [Apiospora arundinis]|uniref:Uncharacterized protein n=1 Tax=Apiospora arundinis TaxID=335852 RepID=A0ABR2HL36_9PEZI